jgi:hypothetical protein
MSGQKRCSRSGLERERDSTGHFVRGLDLRGDRYGKLTPVHQVGVKRGQTLWLCTCDCGGTREVVSGDLRSGKATDCKCTQMGKWRDSAAKRAAEFPPGTRVGDLTVDKVASKNAKYFWCLCSCGKKTRTSITGLRFPARHHSCGCIPKGPPSPDILLGGKNVPLRDVASLLNVPVSTVTSRLKTRCARHGTCPGTAVLLDPKRYRNLSNEKCMLSTWREECAVRGLPPAAEIITLLRENCCRADAVWRSADRPDYYFEGGGLRSGGLSIALASGELELMLAWVLAYNGGGDDAIYNIGSHVVLYEVLRSGGAYRWHHGAAKYLVPDTEYRAQMLRKRTDHKLLRIDNLYEFLLEVVSCREHTMREYKLEVVSPPGSASSTGR